MLDEYLGWYALHRKSTATARYWIEAMIRPVLGHLEVARLTSRHIGQWRDQLAARPARIRSKPGQPQRYRDLSDPDAIRVRKNTVNRVIAILKAALNRVHAEHPKQVPSNDAWKVKALRGADAARIRYLSEGECRRLLNACPDDFRRLVRGALATGCRYSELAKLTVADFNHDAGTLLIREAKSGKSRHIPLDDAVTFFEILTVGLPATRKIFLRADGTHWHRSYQARALRFVCEAARIEPAANFHCLRHTWATHRVMKGAPLIVVATVLGHRDAHG